MSTKWKNFLKNQGEWLGSFTNITLSGEILNSTPSILNLEPFDNDEAMRFRLRRFADGGYDTSPTRDYQQEYRSLGKQIIFFETGAFSKGSLWFAPFAEFGAEYGFVAGDRRLRLVHLYNQDGQFKNIVFIREFRSGTDAKERPPLTVDQLIGTWEGEVYSGYPDFRSPEKSHSLLEIRRLDDQTLHQELHFETQKISSQARIAGNILHFESGRQITLLPDGASSNVLPQLERRQPFFVEVGWLVSDNERQRMMRHYSETGEWVGSSLIIERRVS